MAWNEGSSWDGSWGSSSPSWNRPPAGSPLRTAGESILAGAAQVVSGATEQVTDLMQEAKDRQVWENGQKALKALNMKPFRFNPPLHPVLRQSLGMYESPYDPTYKSGDLRTDWKAEKGRNPSQWRLGQIMNDMVTDAYHEGEYRYGFRFLYNPTAITMTSALSSAITGGVSDGSGTRIASGGIGTVNMELLLNRIPDVTGNNSNYRLGNSQRVADDVIEDLKARGTMVDIDYLYRVSNGIWNIPDRLGTLTTQDADDNGRDDTGSSAYDTDYAMGNKPKKKKKGKKAEVIKGTMETGDIGLLIPTPSWLSIGKSLRYLGWVNSINYTHIMFSRDMVPILTRLTISFQRILRGTKKDFEAMSTSSALQLNAQGDYLEEGTRTDTGNNNGDNGDTGGIVGAAYPGEKGNTSNARYIWNSLIVLGCTPQAAAGVMGNLQQESGLNPTTRQSGGPGMGLAQWTESERWQDLLAWARKKGWDEWNLRTQVGFMFKEMEAGWGSFNLGHYKKMTDVMDACIYFHDTFEASADTPAQVRAVRGKYAMQWYKRFKNTASPNPAPASSYVGGVFILGDSLTVGSQPYITKSYQVHDQQVRINAAVGRATASSVSIVDSKDAQEAGAWVIALGTNDSVDGFRSAAKKIVRKAGNRAVYWINVKNVSGAKAINNVIDGLGVNVIDFHGRAPDQYMDGYHMTDAGYRWRAKLYVVGSSATTSSYSVGD